MFHKIKPLLFQPNVPRTFLIDTFFILGGSVLTDIGIGSNCGVFHADHSLYSYKTDRMLGLSRKQKGEQIQVGYADLELFHTLTYTRN